MPPKKSLLPLLALPFAILGLVFAYRPSLLTAGLAGCPALIVSWRALLAARLAALFPPRPAHLHASPAFSRAAPLRPGVCVPRGAPLRPASDAGADPASGLPLWTAADLARHGACSGAASDLPGCRVLLGVAGRVYDVTDKGSVYYAPGRGYCVFAGRDSTRALALGSLEAADVALAGWVGGVEERAVEEQARFYAEKYGPAVGALFPPAAPPPGAEGGEGAAPGAEGEEGAAAAGRGEGGEGAAAPEGGEEAGESL